MKEDKNIKELFDKMAAFCAYQERCIYDVKSKLYDINTSKEDTDIIIKQLISENYINEERFTSQYVLSKFRYNNWGKIKIRQYLIMKHIDNKLIYDALDRIEENEYIECIKKLIENKKKSVKGDNDYIKRQKIAKYLLGKGFEMDIIFKIIKIDQVED